MDGKQNLSGKMTRFAFGRRDLSLAHSVNEESTQSFAAANCNNNSTDFRSDNMSANIENHQAAHVAGT
jgi:hypothetical protein